MGVSSLVKREQRSGGTFSRAQGRGANQASSCSAVRLRGTFASSETQDMSGIALILNISATVFLLPSHLLFPPPPLLFTCPEGKEMVLL